ncbi:2-oxoglutarate dehydrogenase E1 component [Ichthyobacterium seriolicida]|nr:2-oxoglutarate dehydrogenase E1 component [Ichthyobacterium seriolicida]
MDNFSFLSALNAQFIEDMYYDYTRNPDGIDPSWRSFFQGYDFGKKTYGQNHRQDHVSVAEIPEDVKKEFDVISLIEDYSKRGHLFTRTNPVRKRRKYRPKLDIENYGLSDQDLEKEFQAGTTVGLGRAKLKDIISHLKSVYCSSIGIEYKYIRDPQQVEWIKTRIHHRGNKPDFKVEQKRRILHKLSQAVAFENFLHSNFIGQKRFSIEGGESVIPALDAMIERGVKSNVQEIVVGMSHRGRLNVLANIFGKTYDAIFNEFEGKDFEEDILFDGDVKYHLGWSSTYPTQQGKNVKMTLAPNPSHLESVGCVVEGISRAKIDNEYNGDSDKLIPVIIHGDAAIAGQGVVYEITQMVNLDGYKTGGTIHLVINNQIGFTTNYIDGRSSTYCTDVGKVTLSPVIHVNGDDVESVVHSIEFAVNYRMAFKKDIFIDLLCYRKYGHNEGDEPKFTQPKLYDIIAKHPNPREIYKARLLQEGVAGEDIVIEEELEFKKLLQDRFDKSKESKRSVITPFMEEEWIDYTIPSSTDDIYKDIDTGYPLEKIKQITDAITTIPKDNCFIKKIEKLLSSRRDMVNKTDKIDWGMTELLAYGSLLEEGFNVRLSGQDVERGTFSHRHAIIRDIDSEDRVNLLNSISKTQGNMSVFNSNLSEYAVMGFDYGYAMASPKTLTIWEAQFGDFSNGAQIIIDQYLSSAEDKWKIQNGLVVLLPHGYEGQGAEHSSARMERYLQLCAQNNMRIANCSTPSNFFHLLREQMHRDFRKPLIVFTPKSLLRHPLCTSSVEELTSGKFQKVIDDDSNDKSIDKLVFCSGKLYYELLSERERLNRKDIALVRVEQLYPFPEEEIISLIEKYNAKKVFWVQEEPKNMGAWSHILLRARHIPFELISRDESASPSSGSIVRALYRQKKVIDSVFEK